MVKHISSDPSDPNKSVAQITLPSNDVNPNSSNPKTQDYVDLVDHIQHDVDFAARTILFSGSIGLSDNEIDFRFINAAMSALEKKSNKKGITILINSPGGDFMETLAIIARLNMSPCHVTTIVTGMACSGAALIYLAGTYRKVAENAIFMLHEPNYGSEFQKHHLNKDFIHQAHSEYTQMLRFIAENSNKSVEFWSEKLYKTDCYLTAQDLLDYNMTDKIIGRKHGKRK